MLEVSIVKDDISGTGTSLESWVHLNLGQQLIAAAKWLILGKRGSAQRRKIVVRGETRNVV